jgi:hypothetical protein
MCIILTLQFLIILALNGKYLELAGIDIVYEVPDSPKGVLFVAHGCSHSATDWWPASTTCAKCTGLPVEESIVKEALKRKIAVIAVSSVNRVHKCWGSRDANRVIQAISHFYKNFIPSDSANIPLFLLGASSGGSFVGFLAQQSSIQPPVSALCVQISSVGGDRIATLPSTVFVLMSRDAHTLSHVQEIAPTIKNSKILVTEPRPITLEYFAQKTRGFITAAESHAVHNALAAGGFINNSTFLLEDDPRQTNWRQVVAMAIPSAVPHRDNLIADHSAISELLNVAWDMHEITDDCNIEVFDWFEQNRKFVVAGASAS